MRYRIVSTSPDVTEILCALGLFEDLVGVSRFCDWPPEVKIVPPVSDRVTIDLGIIEQIHPDIVITSGNDQKEIVRSLISSPIRMLILYSHDLQSIFENIRLLGNLFGRQFEAGDLVSRMKRELMTIRDEATRFSRRPRILFDPKGEPAVFGEGRGREWIREMIEIAGGLPVPSEAEMFLQFNDPLYLRAGPRLVEGTREILRLVTDFQRE